MDIEKVVENIRRKLASREDAGFHGDGGPGSGHWGHSGRQGERGGSVKGTGGSGDHRFKEKDGSFTSYSKKRKSLAKAHKTSQDEIDACPKGTKMVTAWGNVYTKGDSQKWTLDDDPTVEIGSSNMMYKAADKQGTVKLALPKDNVNINAFMWKHGAMASPKAGKKSKFLMEYPPERIEKAASLTPEQADETYREESGKIWNSLPREDKEALYEYTCGSNNVNMPLRHREGYSDENSIKYINSITEAIDKTDGLKEDTKLYRGLGTYRSLCKLFNIPTDQADNIMADPSKLIGLVGKEDAFMSTGVSKGKGLESYVNMEIFAPKGTKGLYCEPFSAFGGGHDDLEWDGESGQDHYSKEQEYLVQRGTSLRATGYYYNDEGRIVIQCTIVGQDYSDNPVEEFGKYCED